VISFALVFSYFLRIREKYQPLPGTVPLSLPPGMTKMKKDIIYHEKYNLIYFIFSLYNPFLSAIMSLVLLSGLERTPTFLVPIINPPFADNSPPFSQTFSGEKNSNSPQKHLTAPKSPALLEPLLFDSKWRQIS